MRLIKFSYLNCKSTWKISENGCSETIRLIENFYKLFFSFFGRIILSSVYFVLKANIFQRVQSINYPLILTGANFRLILYFEFLQKNMKENSVSLVRFLS